MKTKQVHVRRLVESAVMLTVATVLSLFPFSGPWALGGGITVCSMLPLVLLSWRYGIGWGTLVSVLYGAVQMFLGMANVQYANSVLTAVQIVLFDYLIAYGVIGFASVFKGKLRKTVLELILGIAVTFLARFACHYYSGVVVWEALFPNELGWAAPIWSLAYNASYMVPEIIITSIAAAFTYKPLKKYYDGADLR